MYRFFCTECKKVKRTQKRPTRISVANAENPTDRIGKCNHHKVTNADYQFDSIRSNKLVGVK